ncbi:MAG: tRNA (N(6)-L-threonylcarbamoyladenosine(37)-C(2))-methylthiotransferase MtaB [Erysipelotrichaceae bacterium]|nr:tRNA (N(6)-L-threonylcarbamoyladenosine(37)-C(2))-methylthiotransferase MtaB [Erysipelotrichaceae bacterium]
MKTYATLVLGCKVNDYEAAYIEQEMDRDYRKVSFKEMADIYIIFSCAVTNIAEGKTRKFIRQARRLNPDAYIAVVGCYVQTDPKAAVFEEVDLLIGSRGKKDIKQLIDQGVRSREVGKLDGITFEDMPLEDYGRKDRAFLKIQDGCNQFCAYCIIPYARGRERSARHEDVIEQAKRFAESTSEIVLTGIHTGRYFDGEYHLLDLLKELVKIEKLQTIRLSSIEITEIPDAMIDFMAQEPKIAPHLHIPLQAGCDRTLKEMNRPYTTEFFKEKTDYIRSKIPYISVSTDLIVGFPGESDEDFAETLRFLDVIDFSFIHLFPYARKKGTAADKRNDFVNGTIVKERIHQVNLLEAKKTEAYHRSLLDLETRIFVEKNEKGFSYGYSREYVYTKVAGTYPIGTSLPVRFTGLNEEGMEGEAL